MAFVAGSTTDLNTSVSTNGVKLKEWNDVKVEALGDVIVLYVNGVEEGQVPNTNRPLLENSMFTLVITITLLQMESCVIICLCL